MSLLRRPSKRLLATLLAFGLTVGLFAIAPLGSSSPASADERYDGETLFEGLYFGIGPVAEHFPDIEEAMAERREASEEEDGLLRDLEGRLLRAVHEADEGFLGRFEEGIQSGDHVAIESLLEEGTALLDHAAGQVWETETELIDRIDREGTGIWWAYAMYLHQIKVINSYDARYAIWFINWAWADLEDDQSRLQREQWINDIAEHLGPR